MGHYGILRNTAVSDTAEDIRGSHLYGTNDEKLGKIDDMVFDHTSADIRYVVVDTGGWLTSKQFIVPAEQLHPSVKHNDDFEVNLTKQQVENFPPYTESDLQSESKWNTYEGKYRAKWVAHPVMHRAETDRNITPTTYQTVGNYDSEASAALTHGQRPPRMPAASTGASRADLEAASRPTERAVPAGVDSVVIDSSAVGLGDRWDTFQSRLRERRKQAVASCSSCAGESATSRGTESTDTLRKAV